MAIVARGGLAERPERPGWIQCGVAVALGGILAWFAVIALVLAPLHYLGAGASMQWGANARYGFLQWPYGHDGAWSVVADLTFTALAIGWATVAVVFAFRLLTGRRTNVVAVALAIFALGYAVPTGLLEASGALGFLLVVWTARAGVHGRPRRHVDRIVVVAVAAACVSALGASVGYGLAHPLSIGFAYGGDGSYHVMLANAARHEVDVLAVEARPFGGLPPTIRVRTDGGGPARNPPWRVSSRSQLPLVLSLPCDGVSGTVALDELRVTFAVDGDTARSRLALPDEALVSCP